MGTGRLHLRFALAALVAALMVRAAAAAPAEPRSAPAGVVAGRQAEAATPGQKPADVRTGTGSVPDQSGRLRPAEANATPEAAKPAPTADRKPHATGVLRLGVTLGGLVGVALLGLILVKAVTRP